MAKNSKEFAITQEKKNTLQIIMIILLLLILIAIGAFGAYMFLHKESVSTRTQAEGNVTFKNQQVYSLPEMTLNLADKESRRYIKIKIGIGFKTNSKLANELEKKKDILSDCILSVIRNKTSENLTGIGVDTMKKDIIKKVNSVLNEGAIDNVFFSEFLIQ